MKKERKNQVDNLSGEKFKEPEGVGNSRRRLKLLLKRKSHFGKSKMALFMMFALILKQFPKRLILYLLW